MATIGDVNVTLNLDTATAALAAIRDQTLLWRLGTEGDVLRDIQVVAENALDQCQAEQSEAERLRAALRELTRAMRSWECKDGPVTGVWYEGRITEECLTALEELCEAPIAGIEYLPDDVRPDAVREAP